MRDCYDKFHHNGAWDSQGDCLEDPWMEPSLVELKHRVHVMVDAEVRWKEERMQFEGDSAGGGQSSVAPVGRPNSRNSVTVGLGGTVVPKVGSVIAKVAQSSGVRGVLAKAVSKV